MALKIAAAAADAAENDAGPFRSGKLRDGYANGLALLNAEQAYQQAQINLGCRPRPIVSPIRRRCFRRWAAVGGIARIWPEDKHDELDRGARQTFLPH